MKGKNPLRIEDIEIGKVYWIPIEDVKITPWPSKIDDKPGRYLIPLEVNIEKNRILILSLGSIDPEEQKNERYYDSQNMILTKLLRSHYKCENFVDPSNDNVKSYVWRSTSTYYFDCSNWKPLIDTKIVPADMLKNIRTNIKKYIVKKYKIHKNNLIKSNYKSENCLKWLEYYFDENLTNNQIIKKIRAREFDKNTQEIYDDLERER